MRETQYTKHFYFDLKDGGPHGKDQGWGWFVVECQHGRKNANRKSQGTKISNNKKQLVSEFFLASLHPLRSYPG